MINDMSHCCHQTRFWALNAPKNALGPLMGELTSLPKPSSCVSGGRFVAGKEGRGKEGGKGEGRGRRGEEGRKWTLTTLRTDRRP